MGHGDQSHGAAIPSIRPSSTTCSRGSGASTTCSARGATTPRSAGSDAVSSSVARASRGGARGARGLRAMRRRDRRRVRHRGRAHRADVEPRPGLAPLDPSGFVKGWALERAADRLAAAGAARCCINAGGDVVVRGRAGAARPWRVGIQHPWQRDKVADVVSVTERCGRDLGPDRARRPRDRSADAAVRRPGLVSATVIGPDLGDRRRARHRGDRPRVDRRPVARGPTGRGRPGRSPTAERVVTTPSFELYRSGDRRERSARFGSIHRRSTCETALAPRLEWCATCRAQTLCPHHRGSRRARPRRLWWRLVEGEHVGIAATTTTTTPARRARLPERRVHHLPEAARRHAPGRVRRRRRRRGRRGGPAGVASVAAAAARAVGAVASSAAAVPGSSSARAGRVQRVPLEAARRWLGSVAGDSRAAPTRPSSRRTCRA